MRDRKLSMPPLNQTSFHDCVNMVCMRCVRSNTVFIHQSDKFGFGEQVRSSRFAIDHCKVGWFESLSCIRGCDSVLWLSKLGLILSQLLSGSVF